MKRILINATHAEEIRVALCNGNHLYDFDLENRTREQKKSNIYKGHVTRVEPSLEAVFVEYGSQRQGFLPIREIAPEYLSGDPRYISNIKQVIKEGTELIIQIEKEERGNKGAALSTFISLAGRYLVLMPNNPKGGGISRQISGKTRDEMKQILADLTLPKGMSVIVRTAGIGKSLEELQHDLDHLLGIWKNIQYQNKNFPSPRLVHQEAGVVTRAMRDYLRDDIVEVWIDNENAYNEASNFIETMMPQQAKKLRKYTDIDPIFSRFGIEKQIETAYQREVRLPSGGSIVIDQTEALVSIDINSAKSTKGSDVSETAFHTNLEAADEIARQLRLRDIGGLIVIDFIDMSSEEHQKQVENRMKEATKTDRARIQFAEISRFGLLEMSRQRLRPSLEEATGYICPRCHGNGIIRDWRSLALSIMRQVEQRALQERHGELQVEVPTEIAAFLLNEKRDTLVYLEQDSGTRITILPHAHLESPNFNITYNAEGFAPSSYERVSASEQLEHKERGYDANWHTEHEIIEANQQTTTQKPHNSRVAQSKPQPAVANSQASTVAWLSNLFAPTPQASVVNQVSSQDVAAAIESIVNTGATSLGVHGQLNVIPQPTPPAMPASMIEDNEDEEDNFLSLNNNEERKAKRNLRKTKTKKGKNKRDEQENNTQQPQAQVENQPQPRVDIFPKREANSKRESRGEKERRPTLVLEEHIDNLPMVIDTVPMVVEKPKPMPMIEEPVLVPMIVDNHQAITTSEKEPTLENPNHVNLKIYPINNQAISLDTVQLSLDNSKSIAQAVKNVDIDKIEYSSQVIDNIRVVDNVVEKPTTTIKIAIENPVTQPQENPEIITEIKDTISEKAVTDTSLAEQTQTFDIVENTLPTSQRFGRASNDPREVYKQFSEQRKQQNMIELKPTALPKITGTVGQFIQQYLPNAHQSMNDNGIVNSFIQAMAIFQQQAMNTSPTPNETATTDNQEFNSYFKNYGYQRLSKETLENYHSMISPVNHHHTDAGKTECEPTPPTKRATNDPRGQIVESVSTDKSLNDEQVIHQLLVISEQPSVMTHSQPTENHAKTFAKNSVGEWIVQQLGEQGLALIMQGKLVSAYLQAYQQLQISSVDVVEKYDEIVTKTSDEDESPNVITAYQPEIAEKVQDDNRPELVQENHSQDSVNKPKTTPASYKNMIESVAEQMQLSSPMVLTLASPKLPKTRTRKVKPTEKNNSKGKTRTSKKVENAVVITKKPNSDVISDE